MRSIESLYEMRFIEKISRPIEKRTKEEIVEKFAGRMENLHNILNRIKTSIVFHPDSMTKEKSVVGSTTITSFNHRKSIRNIESRYSEVFLEGSFKHYKKLHKLNNFSFPL